MYFLTDRELLARVSHPKIKQRLNWFHNLRLPPLPAVALVLGTGWRGERNRCNDATGLISLLEQEEPEDHKDRQKCLINPTRLHTLNSGLFGVVLKICQWVSILFFLFCNLYDFLFISLRKKGAKCLHQKQCLVVPHVTQLLVMITIQTVLFSEPFLVSGF